MTKKIELSRRGFRLVEACRTLYSAIDELDHVAALKVEITRNDLRALNLLENGPVRAGYIAEALALTTGSVSTLIDRLEKRGLATRTPDPEDRRAILVAPTPRLFEELGTYYKQVAFRLAALADGYDDAQLEMALQLLDEIVSAYTSVAREGRPHS